MARALVLTPAAALLAVAGGWPWPRHPAPPTRCRTSTAPTTDGNSCRLDQGGNTITGVRSGKCPDAYGASTANGTRIVLWTCNGGANQKWQLH